MFHVNQLIRLETFMPSLLVSWQARINLIGPSTQR